MSSKILPTLIAINKPIGIPSHSPGNYNGLIEYINEWCRSPGSMKTPESPKSANKYELCHRLDRDTSGALLITNDSDTLKQVQAAFADHQVQKTYLLVTNQQRPEHELVTESLIEKTGATYASRKPKAGEAVNAQTKFVKLRNEKGLTVWQAQPKSGKPHQIRLHAQDLGIAILGDQEHGGSTCARLMLHSHKISLSLNGEEQVFTVEAPAEFNDLSLLADQQQPRAHQEAALRVLLGLERRKQWLELRKVFAPSNNELTCWRWLHTESQNYRVDHFGEVDVVHCYDRSVSDALEFWTPLKEASPARHQICIGREDRGEKPNSQNMLAPNTETPNVWEVQENGRRFEIRRNAGLSLGLFLDQRRNRDWVQKNAAGKRVLNLFGYTGGFSVAAALGEASQVTTVDLSRTFLSWAQENFRRNNLVVTPGNFKAMDARAYLDYALKKQLEFDLIVCDPPSFGRSEKHGVFKIEKDLPALIENCVKLLSAGGKLLFSTNFEGWRRRDFKEIIQDALKRSVKNSDKFPRPAFQITEWPVADWDFELPHEDSAMKCVLIQRA